MSEALAKSVCVIHHERPATARCPSCRRFYCGECVTEHSGRLVCASCLGITVAEAKTEKRVRFRFEPASWIQCAAALAVTWALFYFFARFLGDIPDAFHDGTIWE